MSETTFIRRGWEQAQDAIEENKLKQDERKKNQVYRFWMPNGGETSLIFIDGDANLFWEHNFYRNDSWKNWATCVQGMNGQSCPFCEVNKFPASEVAAFTVIDRTEWASKKNPSEKHKDEIRLFVTKMSGLALLNLQRKRREGLSGCEFVVNRTGDKSPATGSNFDFVKKWTPAELAKTFPGLVSEGKTIIEPADYAKLLAPKPLELMQRLAGVKGEHAPHTDPTVEGAGTTDYDDNVPF